MIVFKKLRQTKSAAAKETTQSCVFYGRLGEKLAHALPAICCFLAEPFGKVDEGNHFEKLAIELTAHHIRESVREHLLAPPHESTPSLAAEFSADKAAGIAEDL